MSAKGYLSPERVARLMRKGYYSPDGVARKLVKGYYSPDGVARLAWEADGGAGEPRAYLYNGMELPPLPEWDKKEYPYACIAKLKQGTYIFGASKSAVLISSTDYGLRCDWEPPSLQSSFMPIFGNTVWANLQYEDHTCGGGYFNDISMWANYDIEYNGEVIVTASEPVPVYD